MQQHNANGQAVAEFLETHSRISKVFYPGLQSHQYHELAKQQMVGFGGLITFEVKGANWRETADIVDRVKIPKIAPSLGGVESLIEQPMIMSYFELSEAERKKFGIRDNMVRISVGIEDVADIISDLEQALRG
jgi:cystathionine gamma-synthase